MVSSADMTWPPNPQNSAETPKPMNNKVPVIRRKHSSLFLPSTSHMLACAICSYAKVCKIVQVEDRSGYLATHPLLEDPWSTRRAGTTWTARVGGKVDVKAAGNGVF